MTVNLALRIVGLLTAIVALSAFSHLSLLVFLLVFLGGFTTHFVADLLGDDFFLDEPRYVLALRDAGYSAALGLVISAIFLPVPHLALILGLVGALTVHLTGDALSVKDSLKMDGVFITYPAIEWVGIWILAFVLALGSGGKVSKTFGVLGLALVATGGFGSYRIYPDGNDPSTHGPAAPAGK